MLTPKDMSMTNQLLVVLFVSTCAMKMFVDTSLLCYLFVQTALGSLFVFLTSVYGALRMGSRVKENVEYMKRVSQYDCLNK